MKSWAFVAVVVVLTGLAVGGILLFKKILEGPTPWSTTSPATQGNLTFLGVYQGRPNFVQKPQPGDKTSNFWGNRWAYFKYPKDAEMRVNDVLFKGKDVSDIRIWGFGQPGPQNPNDKYRYFAAPVPEQYAPGYRNGLLVLRSEGQEVGRWQIGGMPAPERVIKENEPFVLTGEAVGCRFALESPVEQPYSTVGKSKKRYGCSWMPIFEIVRQATDPADKYRVSLEPERTTWLEWQPTGVSFYELPEKGRLSAGIGTLHEMPCDRIAFAAKVQRYRTLDETIVLKDLTLVQFQGGPGQYVLASCANPHIQTKGGFEAEVEFRTGEPCPFWKCFTLNLKSDRPFKNAILEKSPLYQQTKKPITIDCLNWRGSWSSGNVVHWGLDLPPNKGEQTIKIPEFRLKIRQTAVLEEKTLHFLAPTKEVEWVAKPGKPTKAR